MEKLSKLSLNNHHICNLSAPSFNKAIQATLNNKIRDSIIMALSWKNERPKKIAMYFWMNYFGSEELFGGILSLSISARKIVIGCL